MTPQNSIDKRLQRNIDKHVAFLRDRAEADARIARKRARQEDTWEQKQARVARGDKRRAAQLRAFHRRYFLSTGKWHEDAVADGVNTMPKVEAEIKRYQRRKLSRFGVGKRVSYVTGDGNNC